MEDEIGNVSDDIIRITKLNILSEHVRTCRVVGIAPAAASYAYRGKRLLFVGRSFYLCPATVTRDGLFLLLRTCAGVASNPEPYGKSFYYLIANRKNAPFKFEYRPVSLTAAIYKLMESVINDQLTQYLVSKGIVNKHRRVLMKNHTTTTKLLNCINDWIVGLCLGRTDVIYIDSSKASDSIVTSKLLLKLESYDIARLLLNWIRTQCAVVDQCCSPSD